MTGRRVLASLEELSEVLLGTIGDGEVSGSLHLFCVTGGTLVDVVSIMFGCLDVFFSLGVVRGRVLAASKELSMVLLGTIVDRECSGSENRFFVMGETVVGIVSILLGFVVLWFGLGVTAGGVLATLGELFEMFLGTVGEGSRSEDLFFVMTDTAVGVVAKLLGCVDLFFGLGLTAGGVLATLEELSEVLLGTIGDEEGSRSVNLFFVMTDTVVGIVTILLGCVDLFFGLGVTGRGVLATIFNSVNFFPASVRETGGRLFAALLSAGLSTEVKS